jgi:hypothetical protein
MARPVLLLGSCALPSCGPPPAPVEAPKRVVPRDCQVFVDHFGPVASQLLDVRVFTVGDAYLPVLRPSRDAQRVDAIAGRLERPPPPAPKTAPGLLDSLQEVVREQIVDSRGLLAALSRGDIESYRRLSIRYRSGRERLLSLDDNFDVSCGTHLVVRGHLPSTQILAAIQQHEAAFRKCYQAVPAQNRSPTDRVDVKLTIDERGAVRTADLEQAAHQLPLDAGTEAFFAQLGYAPAAAQQAARPPLKDQGVIACVLGEVKTLRFDPVRGGATVRLPITFNGQPPVLSSDD